MTPEEAKRRAFMYEHETTCVDGKRCGPIRMGFTDKETAEIALSFAYAERRHISAMNEPSAMQYDAWREKFKEWSK